MTAEPEQQLVHFHVGGRAGSTSFAVPAGFAEDIVLVLFDADEACVSQAEAAGRRTYKDVISVPYFIGRGEGETAFHVNYDPFTSSAYELNPYFRDYCATVDGTDYVLGEAIRPVSKIDVTSRSLDSLCTGADASLSAPDLLTLDTQASELDILEGASTLLDDHVVAVIAEVQFNDVYRRGALFGDVSAYLKSKGFLFADFNDFNRYSPLRSRLGARSDGVCLFADALFIRDPHRIAATWGARADPALKKLAFLALCQRQLEFAQLCLSLGSEPAASLEGAAYLRFLGDFAAACASLPEPRPWTYAEAFDEETSRARTQPVSETDAARIRANLTAKAQREKPKLDQLSTGIGKVADVLERYGFAFAPGIRRYQELVLKAYRDSVAQWEPSGFTPANDRG
jgi:FkbM family methyltransferase